MCRQRIRILQIEDNPGDTRLIREMLSDAAGLEYVFEHAENLEKGRELILQHDIDIILLDLGLSESCGLNTLRNLLSSCRTARMPAVIVMTGLDDEESGMRAVKQGAQDYLVKNKIDGEVLNRSIRYALERNEVNQKIQQEHDELENKVKERTAELSRAVKSLRKEIIERKRVEEEREIFTRQVHQLQKMESIGTLAGGIAHDFNNILSGIIGYADMSLEEVSPQSRLAHNLRQILQSGDRAKTLIRQILNFSRSNSPEKSPQYLRPIIKEAIDLLRASMPTTIEIKSTLTGNAGPVLAHPTQIHEILMNLCTNAKQAMIGEKGLIEIIYEESAFENEIIGRAGTVPPGTYSVITVRDNGCGMDEETLARVFDPFFTTKPPNEGTGMGMAVLYGIVQSHRGTVTVESIPGIETAFTVYLPKYSGTFVQQPRVDTPIEGGSERILFVDDEELLREMAKSMLVSLGYRVTVFNDSMEALCAFKENPESFDLVISDQTMPVLTGMDLAKEIHKIRSDIPFILCTGYSRLVDEKKTLISGIDCCLHKPFRKRDIAGKIRYVLQKKEEELHSHST